MALTKLGIRHFRNLHEVDLLPARGVNLVLGANASGKTSLLEAIYFLGRASSFRTHRFDRILEKGQESLSVYGTLISENSQKVAFGIEKDAKTVQIRIGGQKINKVAELVSTMPLQIIHPNSHRLLEEGPKFRRQFLDWGVFHVEQSFYPNWQRYQRALKQRNMTLKQSGNRELINAWNQELLESADRIHIARKRYVENLQAVIPNYIEPILGPLDLQLDYRCGWAQDRSLEQVLQDNIQRDREQGFTGSGPHRADIDIRVNGVPASERVSRGQQKILVFALLLAQAGVFSDLTAQRCLLLVDDVAAELDPQNRERLLDVIGNMNVQVFVTCIEETCLSGSFGRQNEMKVFHVEHGKIKEVV